MDHIPFSRSFFKPRPEHSLIRAHLSWTIPLSWKKAVLKYEWWFESVFKESVQFLIVSCTNYVLVLFLLTSNYVRHLNFSPFINICNINKLQMLWLISQGNCFQEYSQCVCGLFNLMFTKVVSSLSTSPNTSQDYTIHNRKCNWSDNFNNEKIYNT